MNKLLAFSGFSDCLPPSRDRVVWLLKAGPEQLIVKMSNPEINVEDYAQKSSVEKALLLHDTNDRVLPVEKSREVARKWPAANIIEVTETGHYKILGAEKVLDKVMDFLIN